MIAELLPALKKALVEALRDTRLTKHQRDPKAEPALAPVKVFIGDLPPTSQRESVFPCVILTPITGQAEGGTNSWVEKYIFPGGEVPFPPQVLAHMQQHDFHLLAQESLRLRGLHVARRGGAGPRGGMRAAVSRPSRRGAA